jgi:hypothetical protein
VQSAGVLGAGDLGIAISRQTVFCHDASYRSPSFSSNKPIWDELSRFAPQSDLGEGVGPSELRGVDGDD